MDGAPFELLFDTCLDHFSVNIVSFGLTLSVGSLLYYRRFQSFLFVWLLNYLLSLSLSLSFDLNAAGNCEDSTNDGMWLMLSLGKVVISYSPLLLWSIASNNMTPFFSIVL